MLRILMITVGKVVGLTQNFSLIIFLLLGIARAQEKFNYSIDDLNFATQLTDKLNNFSLDGIIKKYKELKTLEGRESDGLDTEAILKGYKNKTGLKIFVSSSMPLVALKEFNRQAIKYDGTLIFNGLPGGSFKQLIQLVSEINDASQEGSIQLDDEAFRTFEVTQVPTIILANEKNCLTFQSCIINFDKVEGNIGIKVALEMFARDGDTSYEAKGLLQRCD